MAVLLQGLASRTETEYIMADPFGPFRETIRQGAFKGVESSDVVLRYGHEGIPLASTRSGTLQVWEDGEGLRFSARLDEGSPYARSVVSAVARGDIAEASFAGRFEEYAWTDDYSSVEVTKVDIDRGDVTVCQYGANPETSCEVPSTATQVREGEAKQETLREQLAVLSLRAITREGRERKC